MIVAVSAIHIEFGQAVSCQLPSDPPPPTTHFPVDRVICPWNERSKRQHWKTNIRPPKLYSQAWLKGFIPLTQTSMGSDSIFPRSMHCLMFPDNFTFIARTVWVTMKGEISNTGMGLWYTHLWRQPLPNAQSERKRGRFFDQTGFFFFYGRCNRSFSILHSSFLRYFWSGDCRDCFSSFFSRQLPENGTD